MARDKSKVTPTDAALTKAENDTAMEKIPDFITGGREGTEHMHREDIQLPRLGLAQALSPELTEDGEKYIDGLEKGELFNNLTREVYGRGPLKVVIFRADPPRYVEFFPLDKGGGIKDFNVPADDPRTQFGHDGEKPAATKFYDYLALLLREDQKPEMIALSFKGSGLKSARRLNSLIMMRDKPIYAGVYTLVSSVMKNAKGTFYVIQVDNAGWIQDPELFAYAKAQYTAFKDKEVKFERQPGDDTGAEDFPGDI